MAYHCLGESFNLAGVTRPSGVIPLAKIMVARGQDPTRILYFYLTILNLARFITVWPNKLPRNDTLVGAVIFYPKQQDGEGKISQKPILLS